MGRGGSEGKQGGFMKKPLVGILMGSESDLPIMEKAAEVLKEMGVPYEVEISLGTSTP